MPTIEISLRDLTSLLGRDITKDELEELLFNIKCELEEIDSDKIKIEVKDTNRPDLWSVEGIVRELKGLLGIEEGLPKYEVFEGKYEVYVDPKLKNIRPFIACSIVKDVKLGEDGLSSLIQLQEKVMLTFGRKRRKVAIGTHNFDLIKFPVYYKAVKPQEIRFVPLYEEREMNLEDILKLTETGKEYGFILEGLSEYPILIDSKSEVISFPPIINSNTIGRLTPETKNIFIDVTGTDLNAVLLALNVITLALADRGGKIESVKIIYPDQTITTPKLEVKKIAVSLEKIKRICGFELKNEEIVRLLKKKRMNANVLNDKVCVRYLNYRGDIISDYDIIEEILTAYGYNKIEPKVPNFYTKGKLSKRRRFIDKVREIMIGLGAIELYTPVLVNKEINEIFLTEGEIVEIYNPASKLYNSVRVSILPSILQVLKENIGIELPVKVFEVGLTGYLRDRLVEEWKLIYLYINSEVSFNDAKAKLERLFKELGLKYKLKKEDFRFLIKGRSGKIRIDNTEVGWIGEVDPEILEKLKVEYPMVGFEISLSRLLKIIK